MKSYTRLLNGLILTAGRLKKRRSDEPAFNESFGMFRVLERFSITRRGTVVVLDGVIDVPIGRPLSARVTRPDGSQLEAVAFKEWLLLRDPTPIESEAFLLMSVDKADIPEGSTVTIAL